MLPEAVKNEILYCSPVVAIGEFRCPPGNELWRRTNRIQSGHLLVFPRNFVQIRQAGREAFVSTPNHVVLYNAGQEYTRSLVSPEGDICEFFAFPGDLVTDVISTIDPRVAERPDQPFLFDHALSDSVEYCAQRMLYMEAKAGTQTDVLLLEESAIHLLRHVISSAYDQRGWPPGPSGRCWHSHRKTIDHVKSLLADHYARSISLVELARAAGVSAFHLCRIFRRHVKLPIHRYLVLLRIRAGLERLMDKRIPLAQLAFDLGFSSQSHLSYSIRREIGITPQALRRCPSADNIRRLSKILKDSLAADS